MAILKIDIFAQLRVKSKTKTKTKTKPIEGKMNEITQYIVMSNAIPYSKSNREYIIIISN